MVFTKENYPKEDILKIGRFLIVDIYHYKVTKLLLILGLLLNITIMSVQTYFFLITFDLSYFLLYSPVYFATLF
ncbi:hypothetical protein BDFB_013619, partial [Asbolus verrucosus]